MPEPTSLYAKLHSLSTAHASPTSLSQILAIRSPNAIHAWGHNYLVSRNLKLGERMDNPTFERHLKSTGPYLDSSAGGGTWKTSKVHSITVDEHQRRSVIHMSYFLLAAGAEEEERVEQDMIWVLKFTEAEYTDNGDEDIEKILIKESTEFIDAAASSRVAEVIRGLHGEVREDVRGGITLRGY